MSYKSVMRGDIYYANLNPAIGSEQGGIRPVLTIQNNVGNAFSPTVIIAAMTSQINKAKLPTHIEVKSGKYGLTKDSVILLEQLRTIDKQRLRERIGHVPPEIMERVMEKLDISFGRETKANEKEAQVMEKESSLITIQGVRGFIDSEGTAQLNLEDVSRGLGFIDSSKGETDYVRWNTVSVYLKSFGFSQEVAKETFIPENVFYRLAMKAKNETAEKFQAKVADEILPSIRKTGGYYSGLSKELKAIFITDKKVQAIEVRIDRLDEKVDNEIRITFNQAKEIQFNVSSRVIELLGGKESLEYKNHKGSYFQQLHHDLKDRLGVPSYRDIRKLDYTAALAYIKAWLPKASERPESVH